MDGKLAFWTWAFAIIVAVVAVALAGVRDIRAGRAPAHRRKMLTASVLVGVFLLSYLAKLALLGREDRGAWDQASLWTLYIHELCIAGMLLAAIVAVTRARRFGKLQSGETPAPEARAEDRHFHRRAGRVAVAAGVLALLTAAGVLAGMYARAGT